jgi:FkbM family methyltransferase
MSTATQGAPESHGSSIRFEGLLGAPVSTIENLNHHAWAFLPYNPTIVEVGAHEGIGTIGLAQAHPHARIYACEPNPRAFAVLEARLRPFAQAVAVEIAFGTSSGDATLHLGRADRDASLLSPRELSPSAQQHLSVQVSTATLDDWCARNKLEHIDFLRLDAGGFEIQILQHGRTALETALVVVTKTYWNEPSQGVISYPIVRLFLEMSGFELLSHWYEEGLRGEATFVRKVLYDSLFR